MNIYDFPQYTPEWDAIRRGRATASGASKIITPAKGELSKQMVDYAYELIADMYDPTYGMREDYVSAAMKNGIIMEPESRRWYEFAANADVRQVGFCLTDDGRFGCSPDGLVGDDGGLELKTPILKTHARYLAEGVMPVEYKPQVHWSLIVTGREWWDFMSYSPGLPPFRCRVVPDDYTKRLRDAMEKFWDEFQIIKAKVEATIPPPPPPVVMDFGTLGTVEIPANTTESYW
jgi:hypothetical protein